MPLEVLPSIHDLGPLEQGGPVARTGFVYQDHVAARFCIDMLRNARLVAVWCETLDDITLLWMGENGQVTVEFVQVKSNDLGQMWSVALICDGGKGSLVARSLAQHRCHEPCCFRVVTRVGVQPDLRVLLLSRDHTDRCIGNAAVLALHRAIEEHLKDFYSPGGWSASAWIGHTYWDIAESESAIEHSNLLRLDEWLEQIGEPLFSDQRPSAAFKHLWRHYRLDQWADQDGETGFLRPVSRLLFSRIGSRTAKKAGPDRSSRSGNDQAPLRSLGQALLPCSGVSGGSAAHYDRDVGSDPTHRANCSRQGSCEKARQQLGIP